MFMDTADRSCKCKSGFTLTGLAQLGRQHCLTDADASAITSLYPVSTASTVNFRSVQLSSDGGVTALSSQTSAVFQHLFLYHAVRPLRCLVRLRSRLLTCPCPPLQSVCWEYLGPAALPSCQVVANLCVLQLYDPSSSACQLYQRLRDARPGNVHLVQVRARSLAPLAAWSAAHLRCAGLATNAALAAVRRGVRCSGGRRQHAAAAGFVRPGGRGGHHRHAVVLALPGRAQRHRRVAGAAHLPAPLLRGLGAGPSG